MKAIIKSMEYDYFARQRAIAIIADFDLFVGGRHAVFPIRHPIGFFDREGIEDTPNLVHQVKRMPNIIRAGENAVDERRGIFLCT